MGRSWGMTFSGPYGKANVGISNDKGGEIPPAARLRFPGRCQSARGESGPKDKPNGESDGRHG